MEFKTKFNVGETVYFVRDNIINKGVINEILINVRPCILERYEVKYLNYWNEEVANYIEVDSLFESETELVNKLILDFKNSENKND